MIRVDEGQFVTLRGPISEFGWTRRPDLDTDTYDAWEAPFLFCDTEPGKMMVSHKGEVPWMVRIERFKDV